MKKRLLLLIILPIVGLLATGGVLYFLLVYRLKDSINFIVNRESKGRYAFDASDASLSLWNKRLSVKNSLLYCKDTAGSEIYYKVRIPEMYFSITSWRKLLFEKKLIVDSLAIIGPDIYIASQKTNARKEPLNFQAADIMTYLEKALSHFNVHKFSLKDAAFTYKRSGMAMPLHGDHINLSVANFTVVNNEDSHLLGSDKISVLLGRQHWVLPDGRHEISFNRMTFNSNGQRFELDSFYFRQKADTGRGEIWLYADKFFFSSRHLPAIYQKDQLLLDTLYCVGPILSIPVDRGSKNIKDTIPPSRFRAELFKWINVGYIAVTDGRLLLQNKEGLTQNTATRKANLQIYNLSVDPAKTPSISTDSILLNLKNIEFVTRDSLYKLSIDEFAFVKTNAIFRNARFGPVRPLDKQASFTAPSLLLKDISVVDLLQRRLVASAAELRQPRILLYGNSSPSTKKLTLFYQSLHNLSELISTKDLTITDGALSFRRKGALPLSADVGSFDLHILLNRLFTSDSLADIKHAISAFRVHRFELTSRGATIQADDLTFYGTQAHAMGRQMEVRTAGGLSLKVENFTYNVFDWDVFQRSKAIQIDALHADKLSIHTSIRPAASPTSLPSSSPSPPPINIGHLTVNEISFEGRTPSGPLHFTLTDLLADSLRSVTRSDRRGNYFAWQRLSFNGNHVEIAGKLNIREIHFDSNKDLVAKGLEFESRNDTTHTKLSIPQVRMNAAWHSSDPASLSIPTLASDDIKLTLSKKDTAILTTDAAIHVKNIHWPNNGIQFDMARLDLRNTRVRKGRLQLQVPVASLQLSDGLLSLPNGHLSPPDGHISPHKGQKLSLQTGLLLAWNDAALQYTKDSTSLTVNGMSGSFRKDAFRLSPATTLSWQQAVTDVTITKGDIHYKGKKITADAGEYSWDPIGRTLRIKDFNVSPIAGRDETFTKAKWQGDYIVVKGDVVTLAGIRWDADSLLGIRKLMLDGITLEASRNKQLPFRHGIEKPMPTKLIDAIPFSVSLDSVHVHNSHVTYNELSAVTNQWSAIPIRDINGHLLHVSNRNNLRDTLGLTVAARLFDGSIRYFSYKEYYGDSLSAFSASSYCSPIDLTQFSQVSIPAAAVRVTRGHADTVYSTWTGNKYASYGTMNFYYNNLRIQVLNKKDMRKRGLLPSLETWLANLILPNRRQRSSAIFVQRDREKFVFNYWVKAQASGVLTTVGIKKSRKYRKLYRQTYKQYSLPEQP